MEIAVSSTGFNQKWTASSNPFASRSTSPSLPGRFACSGTFVSVFGRYRGKIKCRAPVNYLLVPRRSFANAWLFKTSAINPFPFPRGPQQFPRIRNRILQIIS